MEIQSNCEWAHFKNATIWLHVKIIKIVYYKLRSLPDITNSFNISKETKLRKRITDFTDDKMLHNSPVDPDTKKDNSDLDRHYAKQIKRTIADETERSHVLEGACRGRYFFRKAEFHPSW